LHDDKVIKRIIDELLLDDIKVKQSMHERLFCEEIAKHSERMLCCLVLLQSEVRAHLLGDDEMN